MRTRYDNYVKEKENFVIRTIYLLFNNYKIKHFLDKIKFEGEKCCFYCSAFFLSFFIFLKASVRNLIKCLINTFNLIFWLCHIKTPITSITYELDSILIKIYRNVFRISFQNPKWYKISSLISFLEQSICDFSDLQIQARLKSMFQHLLKDFANIQWVYFKICYV